MSKQFFWGKEGYRDTKNSLRGFFLFLSLLLRLHAVWRGRTLQRLSWPDIPHGRILHTQLWPRLLRWPEDQDLPRWERRTWFMLEYSSEQQVLRQKIQKATFNYTQVKSRESHKSVTSQILHMADSHVWLLGNRPVKCGAPLWTSLEKFIEPSCWMLITIYCYNSSPRCRPHLINLTSCQQQPERLSAPDAEQGSATAPCVVLKGKPKS